jgi:DNA topoisomerase I
MRTKSEPVTPDARSSKRKKPIRDESPSGSDDDTPLASSPVKAKGRTYTTGSTRGGAQATSMSLTAVNGNGKKETNGYSDSDSDDAPLGSQVASTSKAPVKAKSRRKPKKESSDKAFGDSEDDKPVAQKKLPPKKKRKVKVESDAKDASDVKISVRKDTPQRAPKRAKEEEDVPASDALRKRRSKAKAEAGEEDKKGNSKKEKEEEEGEVFRWWEQDAEQDPNGDGTQKWTTLEHSGVIFPPPYEPLPSNVKMKFDGTPKRLHRIA